MKAVIPAAGLGTRFLPATKCTPKEMLPVVDRPAIQYVVEEAVESGITDILIVTGRGKRSMEDHFDRNVELETLLARRGDDDRLEQVRSLAELADIHFIRQSEPLGLGHAVLCARHHVGDEPFVVLLGDDILQGGIPATRQLMDWHEELGTSMVAVETVAEHLVSCYGIIDPAGPLHPGHPVAVRDLVEKPPLHLAPSRLGIVGRYVLDPSVFDLLAHTPPGAKGEIQLTDALRQLNRRTGLHAAEAASRRHDTGSPLEWLKTNIAMALTRQDIGPALAHWLAQQRPIPAEAII